MKTSTIFNLRCATPKCEDRLSIEQETRHPYGLQGGHVQNALRVAGALLGWRRDVTPLGPLAPGSVADTVHCPKHAADLECVRCGAPTQMCGCLGGPNFDARKP